MATKKKSHIQKSKKNSKEPKKKKKIVHNKKKVPSKRKTVIQRKRSESAKRGWEKRRFRKRSDAAKRGWEKRRNIAWRHDNVDELKDRIRQLEAKVAQQDIVTETITTRYQQYLRFDNLPPRMIQETAGEHAIRIVKVMIQMGLTTEQAYQAVAKHTKVSPREVYTMFCYVGNGEIVA